MRNLIEELTDIDDKKAYARTKEIAAVSERSPEYYSQLETFASLLNDKKSYIRTRAFMVAGIIIVKLSVLCCPLTTDIRCGIQEGCGIKA